MSFMFAVCVCCLSCWVDSLGVILQATTITIDIRNSGSYFFSSVGITHVHI